MSPIALNLANGLTIAEYDETPPAEVDEILCTAYEEHLTWKKSSFGIQKFADIKTSWAA